MHKNDNSMKLLVLIIVAIGAIFFISQWKKIYVHAADIETVSSVVDSEVSNDNVEGGSDIMSAPVTSDIVSQITNVQSSSNDYSERLAEIQNQLTILTSALNSSGVYYDDTYIYNDLHAIALALGVNYSQSTIVDEPSAENLEVETTTYRIFEFPSISEWTVNQVVVYLNQYDYIKYGDIYYDIGSSVVDATQIRYYLHSSGTYRIVLRNSSGQIDYCTVDTSTPYRLSSWFPTSTSTNPNSTTEPTVPTPIVSSSPVSNLYTLVLIQTIFVCMFIIFNFAWHTSSKLRDFTKHKF